MYKFNSNDSIIINQSRLENRQEIFHFFDLNSKKQGDLVFPLDSKYGFIRDIKGRETGVGVGAKTVADMKCAVKAYTMFCC